MRLNDFIEEYCDLPRQQTDYGYVLGVEWYKLPLDADLWAIDEVPVEEAVAKIDGCLSDAFEKIKKYVIPYFRRVAGYFEGEVVSFGAVCNQE